MLIHTGRISMANSILELSSQLKKAVRAAAEYTIGVERDSYPVSGVLIGGDLALTASHLVTDEGARVVLPDGTVQEASLVGRDPVHDLALLRLPSGKFKAPATADAEVGDIAISLRRDPFDGINAALSMVSAAGRGLRLGRSGVIERYIQTGAERMQGSTGGPLADGAGALAGIQVFNRRMGSEIAIPAELALTRAGLIAEKGSIPRPHLGVRSQRVALSPAVREALSAAQEAGLLIMDVEAGSSAEKAGLEIGDILVGLGAEAIDTHEGLLTALSAHGAGASVEVKVMRGGQPRSVPLVIGGA
jgi:S1-C subfamily serine protease